MQQKLAFAFADGIVKQKPIEQEDYWEKEGELKGVEEHVISFINLSQWMVFKCFINSFAF